jgi:hypothetical protein
MKLKELITYRPTFYRKYSARSEICKILQKYTEQEVIVAYVKCLLDNVVLMRGQKCCFGFISISDKFPCSYQVERLDNAEIIKIINASPDKIILNQEIWDSEIKKILVGSI